MKNHVVRTSIAAILTLLALALVTVPAAWTLRPRPPRVTGMPALPAPAAGVRPSGVRPLPIVVPGGVLEELAKEPASLTRASHDSAVQKAFRATGTDPLWFGTLVRYAKSDLATSGASVWDQQYHYPGTRRVVEVMMPAGSLTSERVARWIDVASVLEVGAEDGADPNGVGNTYAVVAYEILDRARNARPGCDVQLALAHLMGLGQDPVWETTNSEFRRAAELCGDDPTALLAWGEWQISQAQDEFAPIEAPPSQAIEDAAALTFERLDQAHPQLSLGQAGLAQNALLKAESLTRRGYQPFVARAAYRQALAHAAEARHRSADPDLLGVVARAELGLGHPAQALEAADLWLSQVPDSAVARVLRSRALVELHRWSDVVANANAYSETRRASGLELAPVTKGHLDEVAPSLPGRGGAVRARVMDASYSPKGGGDVVDLGFLPEAREGGTWAGDATDARELRLGALWALDDRQGFDAELQRGFGGTAGGLPGPFWTPNRTRAWESSRPWTDIARETWGSGGTTEMSEWRQNQLRWMHDWTRAEEVARQWTSTSPDDGYSWDRLGEIQYLSGDPKGALGSFDRAAAAFRDFPAKASVQTMEEIHPEEAARLARVKKGLVQETLGRDDDAARTYDAVASSPGENGAPDRATLYARSQLGLLRLRQEKFAPAADLLRGAAAVAGERDATTMTSPLPGPLFLKGAQQNNAALALVRAGRAAEAVPLAEEAVALDPQNPIYLETLAYSRFAQGKGGALQAYGAATTADPDNHVALNNRGVVLAKLGDLPGARQQFEAALSVRPDYAPAWANLGIAALGSAATFLDGEAALGHAALLDRSLRSSGLGYALDESVYRTGLDVSRALPPDWTFNTHGSTPGVLLGWAVLAIVVLRIVQALVLDQMGARLAAWVADQRGRGGWRGLVGWRLPGWVATLAASGLMAVSLARGGRALGEIVVVGAFTALVVAAATIVRTGRRFTWGPTLLVSGALALLGIAFAPMPCTDDDGGARGFRRATLLLAGIALGLVVAAFWVPVPVVRLAAVSAVVLIASALLPVPPHDGVRITSRWLSLAATFLIGGAGLVLTMGWV